MSEPRTWPIPDEDVIAVRSGEHGNGVFMCKRTGLATLGSVYMRDHGDGRFEARVGLSLFGSLKSHSHEAATMGNPFDEDFPEEYGVGWGANVECAIQQLALALDNAAEGLWDE